VLKRTTEVSGNQTPEACSLLACVSTRQARARPIPARYYIYVRPCGTTQNFLTVLRHFWHFVSTRKICCQLQGYSEFGQYSLCLGIFFQSPQGHLGDVGQLGDLGSLLCWEVILDVMDNSTYKLAAFVTTSVLVRKSARFSPVLMSVSRVSPIATNSRIAWVAN
jgi:hypothetical protein